MKQGLVLAACAIGVYSGRMFQVGVLPTACLGTWARSEDVGSAFFLKQSGVVGSGEFYFSLYKLSKLFELFTKSSDYNKKKLAYKFESLKNYVFFFSHLISIRSDSQLCWKLEEKVTPHTGGQGFLSEAFSPRLIHHMNKADGLVRMGNELGPLANWNPQAEI